MRKIFFLILLTFFIASCSNSNVQDDGNQNGSEVSSSSVLTSSSSSAVLSSSSSSAASSSSSSVLVQSSSSSVAQSSSSSATTISSSSSAAQSSSSSVTQSSSSSAAQSSSSSVAQSSSSSATKASCVRSSSSRSNGTDYSNRKNWGVFTEPDKLTKEMDIFLLYPTTQLGNAAADCPYASIGNTSMRSEADQWYNGIKNVVTANANPYMPYYRQSNVFGGCSSFGNMTGGVAMEDVIDAFEYYLENINKGERPFMLLGFSQGSSPLWELAENRLEQLVCGEANRKNHIITYATGIPGRSAIAANKPVKFSESYNDINVITAWNPYYESDTNCTANQIGATKASNGSPTTNPVTWTTDDKYHAMTENPKLTQDNILGTQVHNKLGILLMRRKTQPNPPPGCASTDGMYMGEHGKDIYWFAESIKQNMADRLAAWKAKYR